MLSAQIAPEADAIADNLAILAKLDFALSLFQNIGNSRHDETGHDEQHAEKADNQPEQLGSECRCI